eukprot:COSAG06_NODE_3288_length_5551_cov_25.524578_7_plen_89_part_01
MMAADRMKSLCETCKRLSARRDARRNNQSHSRSQGRGHVLQRLARAFHHSPCDTYVVGSVSRGGTGRFEHSKRCVVERAHKRERRLRDS